MLVATKESFTIGERNRPLLVQAILREVITLDACDRFNGAQEARRCVRSVAFGVSPSPVRALGR